MGPGGPRKRKDYPLAELVVGGIMLFVFKEGSRNAFDNGRKEAVFRKNYRRAFKLGPPSMDAVEDLYRLPGESQLESLKHLLVKTLIEKKMFHKFRFMGKKYFVAIDGTGVASYGTNYCGECTSKTSKNGKTTYFHNVLEAKLVTCNGMSVSIAAGWVRNENGKEYDKQDCGLNAFKRLAVKLKKAYPRLPMVILADGLYANQSFFRICKDNGWGFIVTFKDGCLPSVHEEMGLLPGGAWQKRASAQNKVSAGQTASATAASSSRWPDAKRPPCTPHPGQRKKTPSPTSPTYRWTTRTATLFPRAGACGGTSRTRSITSKDAGTTWGTNSQGVLSVP